MDGIIHYVILRFVSFLVLTFHTSVPLHLLLFCPIGSIDLGASPFTLFAMSDWVGKGIVIILILGSIFAWTIMVDRYLEIRETESLYLLSLQEVHHNIALLIEKGERGPLIPGPLGAILQVIFDSLQSSSNLHVKALTPIEQEGLEIQVERAVDKIILRLESRMGFLGSIITASPFLGLLGTVWGVMTAFVRLGLSSGQHVSRIQQMAPGIASALLTTVVGLLVAIPSVIGFNYLTDRLRRFSLDIETTAALILNEIKQKYGKIEKSSTES